MITAPVALRELHSERCLCERHKPAGKSFCGKCYFRLPKHLQRALYKRIRMGYEQAFERAINELKLPLPCVDPVETLSA